MSCPRCGLANGEFYGHVCNDVPVGGMALTFSPTCAKCAQLEAENAALRKNLAISEGISEQLNQMAGRAQASTLALLAERDALRADLTRARAVLDGARESVGRLLPHDKTYIMVHRAAWQAWTEAQ